MRRSADESSESGCFLRADGGNQNWYYTDEPPDKQNGIQLQASCLATRAGFLAIKSEPWPVVLNILPRKKTSRPILDLTS